MDREREIIGYIDVRSIRAWILVCFFMAIVFMFEHHLVYSTLFEVSQEAQW